jgi:imidazolonepropionase-like amidohydrolase
MRHGFDIIYHASFADEEALDMLEAQKDKIFVAPGLSVIIRLLYEGEVVGIDNSIAKNMGYEVELEAACKSMKAMLKRGIRVLPGGDYGFAWAPHGENAKDLEYFVKYLGMTPMEALISCTRWGRADDDAERSRRNPRGLARRPASRRRRSLSNIAGAAETRPSFSRS